MVNRELMSTSVDCCTDSFQPTFKYSHLVPKVVTTFGDNLGVTLIYIYQ